MQKTHSFHIPVMGIGFTIDSPLKVAPFGIDSVISLVDDMLLEKLRKMYCLKNELPYTEISAKSQDFRAKRITSYLNLINQLATERFEELKKASLATENKLQKYIDMLPNSSALKAKFNAFVSKRFNEAELKRWIDSHFNMGSIDVNIMTKIDKINYLKNKALPAEYNDAHAALRGYAESDLRSTLILSAGMNPRLYSYIENFADFYPNENGEIKKKIALKVSDYRSALIQGKILAKKGIWVSEFRIESGLNCGGHAFATDGYLMGPILAEFRDRKAELQETLFQLLQEALQNKNLSVPNKDIALKITAQGGVGSTEEHRFLLSHYKVDSVGWGSPFLLVPEATNVDKHTLQQLSEATEDDLYLSDISPLGVPFNSLKNNTKDLEKEAYIAQGRPGSPCPKKYIALNTELTEKSICTASRKFQRMKLQLLEEEHLPPEEHQKKYDAIVNKSCICVGLGTPALLVNQLDTKIENTGVSVCPGPNMAYFSKILNLRDMIDHIYGRKNYVTRTDRPNMFIKELNLYINHFKKLISESKLEMNAKQKRKLNSFSKNLKSGIDYYQQLFDKTELQHFKKNTLNELRKSMASFEVISSELNLILKKS